MVTQATLQRRAEKRRHRLSEIELDEISLVDRPANPGAHLTLFKRDGETRTREAIESVLKGAQSFNAVWNVQDVMDEWYEMASALREAITSILADDTVPDKRAAITTSVDQFKSAIVGEIDETIDKGDTSMPDNKTETKIETVSKADHEKTVAELAKAKADLAIAQMSPEHKAHYDGLAETAKADFLAKNDTERSAIVKAATALPDHVAKAMEDLAKSNADLKARLDKKEAAEADAKALEVAKSILGNSGGDPVELALVVKGMDEKGVEALRKQFEAQRTFTKFAGGKDAFKPVGKTSTSTGGDTVAKATFSTKVDEVRKADVKLTKEQAEAKVLELHPELYEQMEG